MRSRRDLRGSTVVLTRRPEDNAVLAAELRERGGEVLELTCVRIRPLEDTTELAAAIAALGPEDLLVLTSRPGAEAVAAARSGASLACGVAAVGEATAVHAVKLGMRVDFVPSRADGRTLGRELPLPRGEVVLARSDLADGDLPALLRGRGAKVREVVSYRTVPEIDGDANEVRRAIARGPVTIVVASPSAVDALASLGPRTLRRATFVAIGSRTSQRVRERIGVGAIVSEGPDLASVARAIPAIQRGAAS